MISEPARFLVEDMLEYARKALRFHAGFDVSALAADDMRALALVRALEVIGEAASKIPAAERQQFAQIPWRRIIDFRNLLIHGYGRIRTEVLVEVARDHLPVLISQLELILDDGAKSQP